MSGFSSAGGWAMPCAPGVGHGTPLTTGTAPSVRSMPNATGHHTNCEWHFEQYPWECTCGAIPDAEARRPAWLRK